MNKNINVSLREIILKICHDKNLNVLELEKISGLQKDTLRNIIRGRSKNPKFETIITIANALNISIDKLALDVNQMNFSVAWDPFLVIETIQTLEDIRKKLDLNLNFNNAIKITSKSYIEYVSTNKEKSIKHCIESILSNFKAKALL